MSKFSNEDRIDKIAEVMEDLGFEQVQPLKFKNKKYKHDVNSQIEELNFDLDVTADQSLYQLAIDEDEVIIKIPDDEIDNAESKLNSGNPSTVDAHPFALMYMMTRRRTASSITKDESPIDDEQFWIDNYERINKDDYFTYEDIDFHLTPRMDELLS